jgi:hypothetical protein
MCDFSICEDLFRVQEDPTGTLYVGYVTMSGS